MFDNNVKKLELKDRVIYSKLSAFVMGIVNATPDSFWKDSRGGIDKALKLIDEGADLLDIGGESSRPGSDYVSEEEEIKRIVPLIKEIRKVSDIPISVDTRKYNVFKAALENGADILNDISALEDDKKLVSYVAENDVPVILMHKRGIPSVMQDNTDYSNIFEEVNSYLINRAEYAEKNGVSSNKIILDPGIGFAKDLKGNVELIKKCGKLGNGKYNVLMALSRKTCIGEITGKTVEERLAGTLSANLISVINGAFMVRVHDVTETVDSLKILGYTYNNEN